MPKKHYYISVAGVLGSGKTTACQLIARELGFLLFEENVSENVFLPQFYQDPHRWAFHSQLFYVREKAAQLEKIKHLLSHTNVVQDSPLHQDYLTYAKAQQRLGHMSDEEFMLYEKIFHNLNRNLPSPDAIVQLDSSPENILERIRKRGRGYEQNINPSYIKLLMELQREWLQSHLFSKIIIIDTDKLNFAEIPEHQKEFVEQVRNYLNLQ